MKRDAIDLTEVRPIHAEIHARLENWSRWVKGSPASWGVQPMFRHYRSGYAEAPQASMPLDSLDGMAVEKLVSALPEKHRTAVRWWYVFPYVPMRRVRSELGLTAVALTEMVHDARSMLNNRA